MFKNATEVIKKFYREYPGVAELPLRLEVWKIAAGQERFDLAYPDNDRPLKARLVRVRVVRRLRF